MRILVTRPAEDAPSLLAALTGLGHSPIWSPSLAMAILNGPPLTVAKHQAIVITSANAVRALATRTDERDVPLVCVGPASAAAAQNLGFKHVETSDGEGVPGLIEKLKRTRRPQDGSLLYPSASEIAGNLAADLAAIGFELERQIVYTMQFAQRLTPEATDALTRQSLDLATYFSVRSVEGARMAAERAGLAAQLSGTPALCLSAAVAVAAKHSHRRTLSAAQATETAMLQAIERLSVSGL